MYLPVFPFLMHWTTSQRNKKGAICIFQLLWPIGERSPSIFFQLFDAHIQPMLRYFAEMCRHDADTTLIERIHWFALKRLLNTSLRTPNVIVYGETGRYPLFVNIYVKYIQFWFRIVKMSILVCIVKNSPHWIPFKAYKMLLFCTSKTRRQASSVG